MEHLRSAIRAFIRERDWEQFHFPKKLAMALSVEIAEIVEHFQWLTEEQSEKLPPEKLAEIRQEIGDVMIYLVELADKLGIDPVEAAKAKVELNGQKYPAELVRGKNSYRLKLPRGWTGSQGEGQTRTGALSRPARRGPPADSGRGRLAAHQHAPLLERRT